MRYYSRKRIRNFMIKDNEMNAIFKNINKYDTHYTKYSLCIVVPATVLECHAHQLSAGVVLLHALQCNGR